VSEEFVGSGWAAFPMRTDATGSIALVSSQQEVEEAMRLVLVTAPGERPMRPEFGCRIHDHVFAPADATTAGIVAYEVRNSLLRWEPRVDVIDVDVQPSGRERNMLMINIRYSVKHANDPRNLVFPFYTIPPEEGGGSPELEAAALISSLEE
jgi:Bacteriophage baseplate protein W